MEEESEEEIIIEPVKSKATYQQLHSTYSKNLPPENKTTVDEKKPGFYYEDDNAEEEEEEEEIEEDEEVEETEEPEEDLDETEEPEEEEEDISDVDDEELLKKLEAKYGKLPSTRDNKADGAEKNILDLFQFVNIINNFKA